jgi:hypothetical protein
MLDRVFIHDDILGEIAGEMKVKMNKLCDVVFAIKKHLPCLATDAILGY